MLLKIPKLIGPVGAWGFEGLSPKRYLAFDTETTGLDPWGEPFIDREYYPARPFMFTFSDENQNVACARFGVDPFTRRVVYDSRVFNIVAKFLEDSDLEKILFNYNYDITMAKLAGFNVLGRCHDAMTRMHVLDPSLPGYRLKPLCSRYLNIPDTDEKDLMVSIHKARRKFRKKGYALATQETHGGSNKDDSFVKVDCWLADHALCRHYGEQDALRTMVLFQTQEESFKEQPCLSGILGRENKLMVALHAAHMRGIAIDTGLLTELIGFYGKEERRARAYLKTKMGRDFNPNSGAQKRAYFFGVKEHQPLVYSTRPKTNIYTDCQACKGNGCKICQGTGKNPKCDSEFLQSISSTDKIAYKLLKQSAAKTMAGYAKSYDKKKAKEEGTGCYVLHPNINQTGTRTGRLSSSNPNLQNVAGKGKEKTDLPYLLRGAFIPRPGFVFYIPDFSQIEVWILALCTGDAKFIDTLAQGGDAHQLVADLVYPGAYNKQKAADAENKLADGAKLSHAEEEVLGVKKALRKHVKAVNFGIIYGQGQAKTATAIGVSYREAGAIIKRYHAALPAVSKYMERITRQAEQDGFVTSIYGRIYPVERGKEYRGTNYTIQGAASDLLKSAIINVHELSLTRFYLGLLFQLINIHDELICEVATSIDSEKTRRKITKAMVRDYKFLGAPVPFTVGMKVARERWSRIDLEKDY